jgi:hypothetical protein
MFIYHWPKYGPTKQMRSHAQKAFHRKRIEENDSEGILKGTAEYLLTKIRLIAQYLSIRKTPVRYPGFSTSRSLIAFSDFSAIQITTGIK